MSVAGIDFGNSASCVALARKRGIDVIMNNESRRETPSVVSFGEQMRHIGADGASHITTNIKNTVTLFKPLLGKKWADPEVQEALSGVPYHVREGPDGGLLVDVEFKNEKRSFTPVQLVAMCLVDLKKIAETEQGAPVTDAVLTVPCYWTEAERYALLNAAEIAGLKVERLMNETAASALAYGIYKQDLPKDDPIHVVFVDVGHVSMQVAVVAFKAGALEVKGVAWDRNLGGRNFDHDLFEHFAAEFKETKKIDIHENAKARFRTLVQIEKLKKVLSANPEANLSIECLMNDIDVRSHITREKFEELSAATLCKVAGVCERALAAAGVDKSAIAAVELVGGCTRMPALVNTMRDVYNVEPSRTLHSKECVSRGAALQCAMLSPLFHVRDFDVKDWQSYPVAITYEKDGAPTTQTLFPQGNALPSTKQLTLKRSEGPLLVSAAYAPGTELPASFTPELGTFEVKNVVPPPGEDKATLKVRVRLNLHGLVSVESVQSVYEEEYQEPAPKPKEEPKEAPKEGEEGEAAKEGEAAAAPKEGDDAPMEDAAPEMVTKKRTKKTSLACVATPAAGVGLGAKALNDMIEAEGQMASDDKLQELTNEAKNAVEAYVYDLRNKLYDQYADFVKEDTRSEISNKLEDVENWLYEEGEFEVKSVYIAKLEELKALGNPIAIRAVESQTRDGAAAQLLSVAQTYAKAVAPDNAALAHLSDEERAQVVAECTAAQQWLEEKQKLQAGMSKSDDPILLTADISKKRSMIERVCEPIVTKPAPKPEPAETDEKPMETDGDAAAAAPMDTDAEKPAEGEEKPMES